MLINNPPVEITDNLWMLGTNEYPLFLFKGEGEGTIFEGGTGAMGPILGRQMEQLGIIGPPESGGRMREVLIEDDDEYQTTTTGIYPQ